MLREESPGFLVALPDDPPYLGVDLPGRLLAVRFLATSVAGVSRTEETILAWRKGNRIELVAHAPARYHLASEVGGLLDVVLGAGGAGAIDYLFGSPAAQGADYSSTQISFWVVIAIVLGPLVGDAKGLAARDDSYPVNRVGAGYEQAQDGVAALVVG